MRAYINLWGNEYPVRSVHWFESGKIANVTFEDENMENKVIFQKHFHYDPDAETNPNEELLYADLNEVITWKKK